MLQLTSPSYTNKTSIKSSNNSRLCFGRLELSLYFGGTRFLTGPSPFEKSPKDFDADSCSLTSPSLANESRYKLFKRLDRCNKPQSLNTSMTNTPIIPLYGIREVAIQTDNTPVKLTGKSKLFLTIYREEM